MYVCTVPGEYLVSYSSYQAVLNCVYRKLTLLSNLTRSELSVVVNGFMHVCKLNLVAMEAIVTSMNVLDSNC